MATTNSSDAHALWAKLYTRGSDRERLTYPSETLVRLFKGAYYPELSDMALEGKRILDVGFGAGNNLIFLASLGAQIYGTEVEESICSHTRGLLQDLGYEAELRVGLNTHLPFPDDFFDVVVSWSVIHYAEQEAEILATLGEYARVMRDRGHLLVLTTGPQHLINQGAERLDANRVRIARSDDMRQGQVFWNFSGPDQIQELFGAHFHQVRQGRITDDLLGQVQDHFLVAARK